MASNTVTTSIVIDFQQEAGSGLLQVEVDSRADGYNLGVTQFTPGSEPAFLLWKSSNVVIDRIVSSEGTVGKISSSVTISEEKYVTFVNSTEESLGKPIFQGNVTDSSGNSEVPTISEYNVSFTTPQVAVLKVEFSSVAEAYRVKGLSGLRPVVIFIQGHTV